MSNLSELLNPLPNSNASGSPPEAGPSSHDLQKDERELQSLKDTTNVLVQSPVQRATIESPLEALANAATGNVLLTSPTQQAGTLVASMGTDYPSHPSSRPASNRLSPPLPMDVSRQPEHLVGAFSPGLQQYHHPSSREAKTRRLSDITDGSCRTLPPLRRSLPEETSHVMPLTVTGEHHDQHKNWEDKEVLPLATQTLSENRKMSPDQEQGRNHDVAMVLPAHQSETLQSSPRSYIMRESSDEITVKAEKFEYPLKMSEDDAAGGEQISALDGIFTHPKRIETQSELPQNIGDSKIDATYQAAGDRNKTQTGRISETPKATPTRKRAAPKSRVEKKGTASAVKPPPKRGKVEVDSANGTPSLGRSETPASSRASKTPAPRNRKQDSAAPARSSSVVNPNDEDEEDENSELFCICRKPDDHTWMIACDGPCEDWFHGRCVNMNEKDGNLIDKYICKCDLTKNSSLVRNSR